MIFSSSSVRSPTICRPSKSNRSALTPRRTRPPARFTEATLVKRLEEEGIGRPSTYTPIISTIQDREYVVKKNGYLVPTFVGMAVTHLLRAHFAQYVDVRFTARMEDSLDAVSRASKKRPARRGICIACR